MTSLEMSAEWNKAGYKIIRRIGSGGQGTIFLAQKHPPDDTRVAIKVWNDGSNYKAFQREVLNLRNIHHANIVGFLDCIRLPGDGCALVMEYIRGQSLDELLKSCNRPLQWVGTNNGPSSAYIFAGILQGLAALHSLNPPLVHRDVKPSNIMISSDDRVVLVDFGLSKRQLSGQTLTESMQNVCGTPAYLSPEAVMGLDDLDERIDVWAAGVVLHEMLCGKALFRAQNLFALGQQIGTFEFKPLRGLSDEANDFMSRMLVIDRSARYCNAIECLAALEKVRKVESALDRNEPNTFIEPMIFFSCVKLLLVELPAAVRAFFLRHWQRCEGRPWNDTAECGSKYFEREANAKNWPRWVQDSLRSGDTNKWDLIIFNSILLWSSVHPLAEDCEDRADLNQFYEWRKLLALSTEASWKSFCTGNILDSELNSCIAAVKKFSARHGVESDGRGQRGLEINEAEKARLIVVIDLDRQLLRMPTNLWAEGLSMLDRIHQERMAILPESFSEHIDVQRPETSEPRVNGEQEDEVGHSLLNRYPRNHVVTDSPVPSKPMVNPDSPSRPPHAQSSPLRVPTSAQDAKTAKERGAAASPRIGVVGLRSEVVQGQRRLMGVIGLRSGAILGSKGSGEGQLKNPNGVTVNLQNKIIVGDNGNHRVVWYGVDGRVGRCLGSEGPDRGEFRGPCGVTTDEEGRLVVVDGGNHRVQVFSPDGDFLHCFGSLGSREGELKEPRGVALDQLGRIIVADWGNHRVQIFTASGKPERCLGSEGSGDGQLKSPYGVAVDADGMIIVADTSNHRIQVFEPSGRALRSFGTFGAGAGQLKYPNAVAVDGSGRIVVCDNWNHRIQVFDSDGRSVRCFGTKGAGPGQLSYPTGVAIDGDGRIVVSDTANHRIQVF